MAKIKRLTPEQIARFPEFVEKWTNIGLSTKPADRAAAESALGMMYRGSNLPVPQIVWCGSPLGNALTRALVVDKRTGKKVGDSVGASVGDSVGASVCGQHDAGWLGFYDYFTVVCKLKNETAKLEGLTLLCQSAGWSIPHEKMCWVSERHTTLNRDGQGRLHDERGPALAYPDGFAIHAWHGVRVPQALIEQPESITPEQIGAEQNVEIRRVMLERFGAPKYLEAIGAKRVQGDDYGDLYRVERFQDSPLVMVKVLNSTPEADGSRRPFYLRVPPTVQSAREAVAWSFDVKNPEDYRIMAES